MAQWLRALNYSNRTQHPHRGSKAPATPFPSDATPSSDFHGLIHTYGTHKYTQAHIYKIFKNIITSEFEF